MNLSDIKVSLSPKRLTAPIDKTNLGFGKIFTDHIFVMDYNSESRWHSPRIEPYKKMEIDPAAMVLHYGQGVFEGLKCYYANNDNLLLFRPEDNFNRLNNSCNLMCIPNFDIKFIIEALKKLILIDKKWIPRMPLSSLYIRPTIIATEGALGVRPSALYKFFIILTPVGAYYPDGFEMAKIKVSKDHIRIAKGSVGEAKTIGNYAAGLFATKKAQEEGFTQVLWLDSVERKYIEEVGVMNIFFLIGNELITPQLSGSILPGITRDSVIKLAKSWNLEVNERKISIHEVYEAHNNGTLKEAFGTGTAVVISPIGELEFNGVKISIGNGKIGNLSKRLFNHITNLQYGKIIDNMNWITTI